jgi:predicted DNA-binding transcriptional regulator AlpA
MRYDETEVSTETSMSAASRHVDGAARDVKVRATHTGPCQIAADHQHNPDDAKNRSTGSGWSQQNTSYAPRGLRAVAAAAYLGVSKSKFLELVQEQRLPAPIAIDAMRVWDRLELDAAFEPVNSFDAILGLNK